MSERTDSIDECPSVVPLVPLVCTPIFSKSKRVIFVHDAESDDQMAMAYLSAMQIQIAAVIVLNDRSKRDRWNRFEWTSKLMALLKLDSVPCHNCLDLDESPKILLQTLIQNSDCTDVLCLGNLYPFLKLQNETCLYALDRIVNVWTYGSVNIRWAANHMGLDPRRPYRGIESLINTTTPFQFHIFETFGAFGDNRTTINPVNCAALYDWIQNSNDSAVAQFLREAITGWNTVILGKLIYGIGLDRLKQLLIDCNIQEPLSADVLRNNIDKLEAPLQSLAISADAGVHIKHQVRVVTEVCKYPYQLVCADIGLVVACCHAEFSKYFQSCTISFAEGTRFTVPKFVMNTTLTEPSYFQAEPTDNLLTEITKRIHDTLSTFGQ